MLRSASIVTRRSLAARWVSSTAASTATTPRPSVAEEAALPSAGTAVAAGSRRAQDPTASTQELLPSRLPLFILKDPLFPGFKLSLQVAEPRYLVMVAEVLKQKQPVFGHVSQSHAPSGEALVTEWNGEELGTVAQVKKTRTMKNGNLMVDLVGLSRFKVANKERNLLGYWEGDISLLRDQSPAPSVNARDLAHKVKHMMFEYKQRVEDPVKLKELEDALHRDDSLEEFSFKIADLLPTDKQSQRKMYLMEDPMERLSLQNKLLSDWLMRMNKRSESLNTRSL